MTCVVVFDGWMAADGRHTQGSEILSDADRKIFRSGDYTLSGAGDSAQLELFVNQDWDEAEWLPNGCPWLDRKSAKQFADIYGWIHRAGDSMFYQLQGADGFIPLPVKKGPLQAIGSGSAYAKGAAIALEGYRKELGLGGRAFLHRVMECAAEADLYTGGQIQMVRLKT